MSATTKSIIPIMHAGEITESGSVAPMVVVHPEDAKD